MVKTTSKKVKKATKQSKHKPIAKKTAKTRESTRAFKVNAGDLYPQENSAADIITSDHLDLGVSSREMVKSDSVEPRENVQEQSNAQESVSVIKEHLQDQPDVIEEQQVEDDQPVVERVASLYVVAEKERIDSMFIGMKFKPDKLNSVHVPPQEKAQREKEFKYWLKPNFRIDPEDDAQLLKLLSENKRRRDTCKDSHNTWDKVYEEVKKTPGIGEWRISWNFDGFNNFETNLRNLIDEEQQKKPYPRFSAKLLYALIYHQDKNSDISKKMTEKVGHGTQALCRVNCIFDLRKALADYQNSYQCALCAGRQWTPSKPHQGQCNERVKNPQQRILKVNDYFVCVLCCYQTTNRTYILCHLACHHWYDLFFLGYSPMILLNFGSLREFYNEILKDLPVVPPNQKHVWFSRRNPLPFNDVVERQRSVQKHDEIEAQQPLVLEERDFQVDLKNFNEQQVSNSLEEEKDKSTELIGVEHYECSEDMKKDLSDFNRFKTQPIINVKTHGLLRFVSRRLQELYGGVWSGCLVLRLTNEYMMRLRNGKASVLFGFGLLSHPKYSPWLSVKEVYTYDFGMEIRFMNRFDFAYRVQTLQSVPLPNECQIGDWKGLPLVACKLALQLKKDGLICHDLFRSSLWVCDIFKKWTFIGWHLIRPLSPSSYAKDRQWLISKKWIEFEDENSYFFNVDQLHCCFALFIIGVTDNLDKNIAALRDTTGLRQLRWPDIDATMAVLNQYAKEHYDEGTYEIWLQFQAPWNVPICESKVYEKFIKLFDTLHHLADFIENAGVEGRNLFYDVERSSALYSQPNHLVNKFEYAQRRQALIDSTKFETQVKFDVWEDCLRIAMRKPGFQAQKDNQFDEWLKRPKEDQKKDRNHW